MKGFFVRLPNWLGDAVMALPALTLILRAFPDRHPGIIGPAGICDLFANFAGLERIRLKRRGYAGIVESVRAYRTRKIQSVLLLTNSFASALAAFLGNIPERLGLATDGRKLLLTDPVPVPPREFMHEQDVFTLIAREALVRWKGENPALDEMLPYPRLNVATGERERVRQCVDLSAEGGKYAVIHPGAAYGAAKRWPVGRFARIARRLVDEFGWDVYLLGSSSDFSVCQEVARLSKTSRVVNLAGRTGIREMLALQADAGLVLANDSGAAHTAAALGVPVIVIFGPTDPKRTAPKNPNSTVVQGLAPCAPCTHRRCPEDHRCMTSIQTDRVWTEIARLFEKGGRNT